MHHVPRDMDGAAVDELRRVDGVNGVEVVERAADAAVREVRLGNGHRKDDL